MDEKSINLNDEREAIANDAVHDNISNKDEAHHDDLPDEAPQSNVNDNKDEIQD